MKGKEWESDWILSFLPFLGGEIAFWRDKEQGLLVVAGWPGRRGQTTSPLLSRTCYLFWHLKSVAFISRNRYRPPNQQGLPEAHKTVQGKIWPKSNIFCKTVLYKFDIWQISQARASPVYKSVVFETSHDVNLDDPLKKCFEYARQARINADQIPERRRTKIYSILIYCSLSNALFQNPKSQHRPEILFNQLPV
jgi:hypothetical protein